jgi:hypothetical protein
MVTSNLTRSEIYEVAEAFAFGDLGRQLGEMLRDASMLIPEGPAEAYPSDLGAPPHLPAMAYETVQRRKIGKANLLQLIKTVAPSLLKSGLPSGASTRRILEWFFDKATTRQASHLFSLLADETRDPYLKGIVRRS